MRVKQRRNSANSEVSGAVQQAVGEALSNYLEEHPIEAKKICEKVVLAATARIAARKARESVQRKSVMSGGGLPGKLADCSNKDPKDCEIFLVEGDSAGGSAKQGRVVTPKPYCPCVVKSSTLRRYNGIECSKLSR